MVEHKSVFDHKMKEQKYGQEWEKMRTLVLHEKRWFVKCRKLDWIIEILIGILKNFWLSWGLFNFLSSWMGKIEEN